MNKNKVVILTAAGTGIGADAAKQLASDGFNISILSSSGKGEALAKKLGGFGVTGSNQSNDDIKKIVKETLNKWGRIDVLVKGMDTYFMNVVRSTRLVTPFMQKQKYGVIINISTFATFEPESIFPTSGVFRAGLASFTKLYADRYAADNIRMNNILPGFIDSLPEKEEFKVRIPLKRYGKTREISEVVCFLASDGAGYITGQNIRVDGGITKSV